MVDRTGKATITISLLWLPNRNILLRLRRARFFDPHFEAISRRYDSPLQFWKTFGHDILSFSRNPNNFWIYCEFYNCLVFSRGSVAATHVPFDILHSLFTSFEKTGLPDGTITWPEKHFNPISSHGLPEIRNNCTNLQQLHLFCWLRLLHGINWLVCVCKLYINL